MKKSELEAKISDEYYQTKSEIEPTYKNFMRAMVPSSPPLRILDVGCGTGLNASHLVQAGHRIVGIDLSSVAIEKCRERGFEAVLCDIDSEPIPYKDETFDLAYASDVVEHCADTAGFLRELHRVLKPGGMLLLSTPNSAFWVYRILGLLGLTASEYQHPGHIRFFSIRNLSAAIEAAGFKVTRLAARHMYVVLGMRMGDPFAPLLQQMGFQKEVRWAALVQGFPKETPFITGDHFWQVSGLSKSASALWADTLIIEARKDKR
jgi:2-polyprenyl-3-methyl-5-hydroxy-6-metoxy-1,4-benzoquinol methylase